MPEGEDIHMLQVFLRPRAPGLEPTVQFARLDEAAREGRWRALVAPEDAAGEASATVRTDARASDARLSAGESIEVPRRDGANR